MVNMANIIYATKNHVSIVNVSMLACGHYHVARGKVRGLKSLGATHWGPQTYIPVKQDICIIPALCFK